MTAETQIELKRVVKVATAAALGTAAGVVFFKNREKMVAAVHAHKSDSILIDLLDFPKRVAGKIVRDESGGMTDVELDEPEYPYQLIAGIVEVIDADPNNSLQSD